jgi:hypothetical protein
VVCKCKLNDIESGFHKCSNKRTSSLSKGCEVAASVTQDGFETGAELQQRGIAKEFATIILFPKSANNSEVECFNHLKLMVLQPRMDLRRTLAW